LGDIIWISAPVIKIPSISTRSGQEGRDLTYKRCHIAYSCPITKEPDGLSLPRSMTSDVNQMAAKAITPLLRYTDEEELAYFIDCRSSIPTDGPAPTYRLAKEINILKTVPFSLTSQGGIEVSQALYLLQFMLDEKRNAAILSASQLVNPLDHRDREGFFPFADASASILITYHRQHYSNFQVLGTTICQKNEKWETILKKVVDETCEKSRILPKEIKWSIPQMSSDFLISATKEVLPQANTYIRDIHPNVNFGSADTLISLHGYVTEHQLVSDDLGILWFTGQFDGIGAAIIKTSPVEIKRGG